MIRAAQKDDQISGGGGLSRLLRSSIHRDAEKKRSRKLSRGLGGHKKGRPSICWPAPSGSTTVSGVASSSPKRKSTNRLVRRPPLGRIYTRVAHAALFTVLPRRGLLGNRGA